MGDDLWREALFIVVFLTGISALLLLMVYLEVSLDNPDRRPRR